ncbi:MAG: di-trans,poly-cis-decaprenylcistransferase [Rhodospirillales bacterium CG15_BIG_FIL_POST_REV_8_21_14_020_66_15]|nr:MAG: di-trans,poly-cis-decaprenylcistransferase [Rhodospirillales bacterium CG15_BIG_FIL_POST_REV_8_21_14_020_66_15]
MTTVPLQYSDAPADPLHVAVIMDGNGRWAQARGLPRTAGHKAGAEAVRRTVKAAASLGVPYLTLFGFSSENWKRPQGEVGDLMGLLRLYLRKEVGDLDREGVRLRIIGDRTRFDEDIQRLIDDAEGRTSGNTRLNLTIALSYGGRQEILNAARSLAEQVRLGGIDPDDIDEARFQDSLYTAGLPDPDLLIRTSGEQRVSNFLLWQVAYAEFVFTDVLWPDFGHQQLAEALDDFRGRERRFGGSAGA